MRSTVVITHWVHDEIIDLLKEGYGVISNNTRQALSREEILRRARNVNAIIFFMHSMNEISLEAARNIMQVLQGEAPNGAVNSLEKWSEHPS